jgi:hypothetical protein
VRLGNRSFILYIDKLAPTTSPLDLSLTDSHLLRQAHYLVGRYSLIVTQSSLVSRYSLVVTRQSLQKPYSYHQYVRKDRRPRGPDHDRVAGGRLRDLSLTTDPLRTGKGRFLR